MSHTVINETHAFDGAAPESMTVEGALKALGRDITRA